MVGSHRWIIFLARSSSSKYRRSADLTIVTSSAAHQTGVAVWVDTALNAIGRTWLIRRWAHWNKMFDKTSDALCLLRLICSSWKHEVWITVMYNVIAWDEYESWRSGISKPDTLKHSQLFSSGRCKLGEIQLGEDARNISLTLFNTRGLRCGTHVIRARLSNEFAGLPAIASVCLQNRLKTNKQLETL